MHKVTLGVLMIFFHSSGGVWLPPHGHGFLQNDRSLLWGWSRWLQVTDNKPERPPYMVETLQVSRPPVWTWHSWTTCVRFTICRWGCQDWRIMSLQLLLIFEIPSESKTITIVQHSCLKSYCKAIPAMWECCLRTMSCVLYFFSPTTTRHCLCTPLFLQNASQLKCQAEKGGLNMRAEESWLYHLDKWNIPGQKERTSQVA